MLITCSSSLHSWIVRAVPVVFILTHSTVHWISQWTWYETLFCHSLSTQFCLLGRDQIWQAHVTVYGMNTARWDQNRRMLYSDSVINLKMKRYKINSCCQIFIMYYDILLLWYTYYDIFIMYYDILLLVYKFSDVPCLNCISSMNFIYNRNSYSISNHFPQFI